MQMYLLFLNNTYISMYSLSAPTRGATRAGSAAYAGRAISTRAPTRGATHQGTVPAQRLQISTRAPTRGATDPRCGRINVCRISIRAPTRGATVLDAVHLIVQIFQSALPRGERRIVIIGTSSSPPFQSALPRGERRKTVRYALESVLFQSALPRGERLYKRTKPRKSRGISIRAPTRGATCAGRLVATADRISIRAPTRGATSLDILLFCGLRFQSALPRGERP